MKQVRVVKLWGKEWCREQTIDKTTTTWKLIKEAVKERYLPLHHETLKMNEFYGLTQKHLSVNVYYFEFVKLKRYAPPMNKPQTVSYFVRGLNPPLNHRLESMRPESLQDVVLQAKPLEEEIRSSSHIRKQTRLLKTIPRNSPRPYHNLENLGVSQHKNFNSSLLPVFHAVTLTYILAKLH